jgi:TolB protein
MAAYLAIWTIGAAGGSPTRVTDSTGDENPTWSPDGERIAFRGGFRDPQGIYIVDADGGTPELIPGTAGAPGSFGFARPSWSPDGRRIAAASGASNADIVTFSPTGQSLRNLTNSPGVEDTAPDWSPGGGRIVFTSDRPIPSETVVRDRLYLIDADGTDLNQLTFPFGSNTGGTTVEDANPSWSPDGLSIAFARSHQNSSRFVMTRVISEETSVPVTPPPTNTTDHTFDMPDWQPIPVP